MASYTVQIILVEPTHESKGAKYAAGDVVAVYPRATEPPNSDGRLCFIHVDDAPDDFSLQGLEAEINRPVFNVVEPDSEKASIVDRSAWGVDFNLIDVFELNSTRETIISWSDARLSFIRKYDGKTGGEYYDEREV